MQIERKSDMLAFFWCSQKRDYELMLSWELSRWAIPLEVGFQDLTYELSVHVRVLCFAAYFSWGLPARLDKIMQDTIRHMDQRCQKESMGEHACNDRSQCFEPCGALWHDGNFAQRSEDSLGNH